jgi:dipeptidyl aminopeptidase/acylaminoacyl peptidase
MARRPFAPEDIRRQVVLEEHDVSADGRVAAVGRRSVRGDRYVAHLYAVSLDGARPKRPRGLTSGLVLDRWPRLSPDGSTVAFIRRHPDDEDRPATIHLVSSAGGRVRAIRRGAHGGVDSLAWSPDGTRLAFTAEADPPRFLVGRVPPLAHRHGGRKGHATDPSPTARRITRTDWRWDGVGHLDHWSHLFVVDVARGAKPRQVTAGDWGVAGITWGPDGRTVAFTTDRGPEADLRPRTTVWAVDVDAHAAEPREVLAAGGSASGPAYSPDGRWLAAVGVLETDALDDVSPGLLLGPVDGSAPPIDLTPGLDRPVGNWVDSDLTGWMVDGRSEPAWIADDRIAIVVSDRGRSQPWQVTIDPATGEPLDRRCLADGDLVVHSLATSTSGLISWLGTDGTRAMELTTLEVAGPSAEEVPAAGSHRPRVRTSIGAAWQRRFPQPVMVLTRAPGAAGPIDVWIASPQGAGDRPLPAVLNVHGGPLGAWSPSPHIEVALLVGRGYRVILPNIRGSTSYGRGWIRPQLGDWGGVDADDVHAAVDHVIALGLADPDRLGVLGFSYGGFMVNWLVGATDRFRAAVSESGVTNQVSDWANSDGGPEYDRVALLGDPFSPEGIDKLWRQSPLRNVTSVHTPLLLLQGEADLNCPPQDNEQFFIALRHLGRTVEYVLYPEESHVYGNAGRPDRRIDRHTRMLDWFDRYLRG